jgi:hypothetical protein
MDVRAVLCDVAGTLAVPLGARAWLADAARVAGVALQDADGLAARLAAAGLPGGQCGIRTLLLPMSPAGATHGLGAVLALV